MEEAQSFSLLPEEPVIGQPLDSLLPAPTTPTAAVPRNIEEVGAQITQALDVPRSQWAEATATNVANIRANGVTSLHTEVVDREFAEREQAAKDQTNAAAKVGDVQGATFAAQVAAGIAAARAAVAPNDHFTNTKTAVSRALESLSASQQTAATLGTFDRRLDAASSAVAWRNLLALEQASTTDAVSWWDRFAQLARGFIQPMDDILFTSAIGKVVGENLFLDKWAAIGKLRDYMSSLPDEATRVAVIRNLIGELSSNPAIKAEELRQILELSKGEFAFETAMNALNVVQAGALVKGVFGGLAGVARRGLPIKAVDDVAGSKAAGQMAATDLLTKGQITGLSDPELIAAALAAGKSPMEINPGLVVGAAPHMQEALRNTWNTFVRGMEERLNSGTRTPEEIAAGAAEIQDKWMNTTNKALHSVQHGEASADGLTTTAYWQGRDGMKFLSREAAEADAARMSQTRPGSTFTVVPVEEATTPSPAVFRSNRPPVVSVEATAKAIGEELGGVSHLVDRMTDAARIYLTRGPEAGRAFLTKNKEFREWLEFHYPEGKKIADEFVEGLHKQLVERTVVPKNTAPIPRASTTIEAEELAAVKTYAKKDIATTIKELEKEVARIRKNYQDYDGTSEMEVRVVRDRIEAWKDLQKDAVEAKTAADVDRFWKRAEEHFGKQSDNPLVEKYEGLYAPEDVAVALKGQDSKAIKELFDQLGFTDNEGFLSRDIAHALAEAAARGEKSVPLRDILSIVAKQSVDADYRYLAALLLKQKSVKWESVAVSFTRGQVLPGKNNVRAVYHPDLDRIVAGMEQTLGRGAATAETFLHEALHAHNAQILDLVRDNPDIARKLLSPQQFEAAQKLLDLHARLVKLTLKAGRPNNWVAATADASELISYGTTDTNVRKFLSTIKLSQLGYTHNEQTMWSYLWDEFKKFVGVRADDTALAKLYAENGKLLTTVTEAQRTEVSTGWKQGRYYKSETPPSGEWLVREERHDPLSYASVGKFGKADIESRAFISIDPKHGASEQGVEARVVGLHAEAKTRKELNDFIQPYYKGMSRDGIARVRSVLEEGDSYSNGGAIGREFTYNEVRGKGLSDDEAVAYLATRQLRGAMYHLRNGEMVRHLQALGLKEIEFTTTGFKTAGKVVDTEGSAGYVGKPVYDMTTKTTVVMDTAEMAAAYGSGKRIIRLHKEAIIDGDVRRVMLVDSSVAKGREIVTALNYRPGEFARIYTDEYFIRMKRKIKVDGVEEDVEDTVRTARSAREATEFTTNVKAAINVLKNTAAPSDAELQKLIGQYFNLAAFKKMYHDGEFEGMTDLYHHFTRNQEEYINGSVNEAISNGRLFTNKRSGHLLSVDANRVNTLGVWESLQAEMSNVSRVANIGEWRENMVRRWMNTFGDLLPKRTGNDVQDFYDAAGAVMTKGESAKFAESTHRYIMRQIGQRSSEEEYWGQLTRTITEKFFTGNDKLEVVGAAVRKASLLGFIRSANFNLTLGMFNPAQLLVQANGAAAALLLSPLHGLAAAKTFPLLRMALMSDNPKVWEFFAKVNKFTDLGLSDAEEFYALVKAVRQTGILNNMKSTALYNLEEGKFNMFGSYPQKAWQSQGFFFNRGEEFSRLVSFDVARREFVAAHPDIPWNSKESLAKLVVRMDDLTQNMTKANEMHFGPVDATRGIASIPLQFAQYNIKLAANVMTAALGKGEGRGFSRKEAVALLAGNVLLYGLEGNGLVAIADAVLPDSWKEKMPASAKLYMAQGLISGLVGQVGEWASGQRSAVALGSRLGAFNYYEQLATAIFTDPKNIYNALLGPTVQSAKRLGAIGDVAYLWWKDPHKSGQDVLEGLQKMGTEQVTSLRNVTKAYLFMQHQGKMLDSRGLPLAQLTPMELLGQALGFQPAAAVDVSNLIKNKRHHDEAIGDLADHIYQVQKTIMAARNKGDDKYADEQHKLLQALWPENTGDMAEVQRRIRDKLYPYDTQMEKLMGDYLNKGATYQKPMVVTTPSGAPSKGN